MIDVVVVDDHPAVLAGIRAWCALADPPITVVASGEDKAEGPDHLVAAIEAAHTDHPYVSPSLAGAMGADRSPERPQLTVREREVLLEWFRSESKQLVADRLGLSPRTIASDLDRLRIKYANTGRLASTKATLVARAIQDGLLGPDDL